MFAKIKRGEKVPCHPATEVKESRTDRALKDRRPAIRHFIEINGGQAVQEIRR